MQLRSELGKLRNSGSAKASETVRQLEDLRGRFKVLDHKYEAAKLEASEKAVLESKLATAVAELDSAKLKIAGYEKEAENLAHEITECKTVLLQSRAAGAQFRSQQEELKSKADACTNDLRRQLSQAEAKAKFAEAGLDQMRNSAEKTISEEQEKHRKQQEALQNRLNEAQTELQMSNIQADDTRVFVERTVKHQQEAWQKSHADLESKISEYKLSLELKSSGLNDVQTERDTLQMQLTQLQTELHLQRESDTQRKAREATNQGVIDDLRHEYDAAQKELAGLQAIRHQHDRLRDESAAREAISKDSINVLQKEHDSAKALIATLQTGEKQRASDDVERAARENVLQREIDDLRNARDTANNPLRTLCAASDDRQNIDQIIAKPLSNTIVPPQVTGHSAPVKQRRRADRNTNTIVTENVRNETQPTESRAMPTQMLAFPPFSSTLAQNLGSDLQQETASSRHQLGILPSNSEFPEKGEMLDSTYIQGVDVKDSDSQFFGSSMQTNSTLNGAGFPNIKSRSSQAFDMPLDFSGKQRVGEGRSLTNDASSAIPSQILHSPGFQIYEDSQVLVSDGQLEEEPVRDNYTFRKPFPPSNSASKRVTRTTSNKSLESDKSHEGRAASSRRTEHQPDNTGNPIFSQSNKTPETSNYAFGSSPDFMNPPSSKMKRQYSGLSRPVNSSQPIRSPSSPMPDPRLVARSVTTKRGAQQDSHQTDEPATKRRAVPAASNVVRDRTVDESLLATRSSQSVKDLPRVEDMNAGRNANKSQPSHMRSSGTSTRTTRNQPKASRGMVNQ